MLSDQFCLHCLRAEIPVGAVAATSIVVDLDVFEHDTTHVIPGEETFTVDHLHLQRMEEAFGTGIVVAVALGAHAAHQMVLR